MILKREKNLTINGGDMGNVNSERINIICDNIIAKGNVENSYKRLREWIYNVGDLRNVKCPFGMISVNNGQYEKCLCHIYWPELVDMQVLPTDSLLKDKATLTFCPCKYIHNFRFNRQKILFPNCIEDLRDYPDTIPHAKALLKKLGKRCKISRFDDFKYHAIRILLMEL